jgi:peptidoglycan/LPS O-acetylase OafA/YrhL
MSGARSRPPAGPRPPARLDFLEGLCGLSGLYAVSLGSFSYSLYLIHFPLLARMGHGMRASGWGAEVRFWAMLGLATPSCLLAAWAFHLAFERRTVPPAEATAHSAPPAPLAIGSPAHLVNSKPPRPKR